MDRDGINRICAAYPGAEVSDPWGGGHDAWKVGGKMFAMVGANGSGLFAKTAAIETASMLIDAGVALRAPYLHRSWVLIPFTHPDDSEFEHRIRASYDLIFAKLPKKLQATLANEAPND